MSRALLVARTLRVMPSLPFCQAEKPGVWREVVGSYSMELTPSSDSRELKPLMIPVSEPTERGRETGLLGERGREAGLLGERGGEELPGRPN